MGAVAYVAYDIAVVARQPTRHMFTTKMPAVPESTGPFHIEQHLPRELAYESEWAPSSLTAEMANIGTIDCGTFPAFHNYFRHQEGHVPGLGAHGVGDKGYRGEAFIPEGAGTATVTSWTPNAVTVEVHGAQAGEHLVLNQNYDPGWSASGRKLENWKDTLSAGLDAADATVVFRYRPPTFWPGVSLLLVTMGWIGWAYRRARRGER